MAVHQFALSANDSLIAVRDPGLALAGQEVSRARLHLRASLHAIRVLQIGSDGLSSNGHNVTRWYLFERPEACVMLHPQKSGFMGLLNPVGATVWGVGCVSLALVVAGGWNAEWAADWSAEHGLLEMLSAMAWCTGGAWLLSRWPFWGGSVLAWAMVCLALAVREVGIPETLVPSGKALLTWAHYMDPAIALSRRLAEGALVSGMLISGLVTVWQVVRAAWRLPRRLNASACLGLAGGALLLAAQAAEAVLGVQAQLLEEVLECAGALWVLASLVLAPVAARSPETVPSERRSARAGQAVRGSVAG